MLIEYPVYAWKFHLPNAISQQLFELSTCSYSSFGDEETESKVLKHSSYFPRSHKYNKANISAQMSLFQIQCSFHFN